MAPLAEQPAFGKVKGGGVGAGGGGREERGRGKLLYGSLTPARIASGGKSHDRARDIISELGLEWIPVFDCWAQSAWLSDVLHVCLHEVVWQNLISNALHAVHMRIMQATTSRE